MKIKYIFLIIFIFSINNKFAFSQFDYSLYGFVKTDVIFDTRQNVTAREGHLLLYPTNVLDAQGEDANDGLNFNILSIQSRAGIKISAPEFLGAKSSGLIEGEFFGSNNSISGAMRMRHAYLKLQWNNHEVLAGQTWNPIFIDDCYPLTISFNTGIPFVQFSRNPMIKYTYIPEKIRFHISAIAERDYSSPGPEGETSSYLRNSGLPIFNFGTNYDDGTLYFAANVMYKEIRPRLVTEKGFIDENRVKGFLTNALIRYKTKDFSITGSAFYGQNTYNLMMLGGYGVSEISQNNGKWEYTPINVASTWFDINYGDKLSIGLFGGYSKNLGADKEVITNYFSRGKDIDYLYRISPRIVYKMNKTQLAGELECTSAAYGTNDNFGKVINSKEITNYRILLAAYLFF